LEKTPELKDRFKMLIMVVISADIHCFRIEIGIRSVSHNVLDECKMSFEISSLVAGLKKATQLGLMCGEVLLKFNSNTRLTEN